METHIEFFVQTKYNSNYSIPSHTHGCYELIYYLKGKGHTKISSKNYEFNEDDFAIIAPNSVHEESSSEGAEVMFMGFTLRDATVSEGVFSNDTIYIKKIMFLLKEEKENKHIYYKQMMDLLVKNIVIFLLRFPVNNAKEKASSDEILTYVKMNSNKQTTIKTMANDLGYSYDYFRQMFMKKYNISAKDFIIKTRLENVKNYLLDSHDMSIDQISRITGFSSSSHLCAVFKKFYGVGPNDYKKRELKRNIEINSKNEEVDIKNNVYPGNKLKAITFSFDDNTQFDSRLVRMFDKYNLKCTFNVNSGISNHSSNWTYGGVFIYRLNKDEMKKIYPGHEVASHSLTHPHLFDVNNEKLALEIGEDVKNLTQWFPINKINGFAYPYGQVDDRIINELKKNGILWARTAGRSRSFDIPTNLFKYTPTCHFLDDDIDQIVDEFLNMKTDKKQLLCIWGHSNELEIRHQWANFEKLLKKLSNRDDIYYCTNSEGLL